MLMVDTKERQQNVFSYVRLQRIEILIRTHLHREYAREAFWPNQLMLLAQSRNVVRVRMCIENWKSVSRIAGMLNYVCQST